MRDPSSMEGALVRRGPLPLTRRRGEAGLAARRTQSTAPPRGEAVTAAAGRDRGRQRPRHEPGSRSKTPRPGGTARRSYRSKLRQDRAVPSSTRALGAEAPDARSERSWAMAEAGGSPSSDALPVASAGGPRTEGGSVPVAEGRPARGYAPRGARPRTPGRAGIGGSVPGARDRKSVAEVGERHLSPCTLGAPRRAGQARG
jgi:hypothetical protein